MLKYPYVVLYFMIGVTISLGSVSVFAQRISRPSNNPKLCPHLVSFHLVRMRQARGFGNTTDLQSLTGLNQAAMENETGNQSAAGGQQQQSNQSVAGAGSAITQNESKSNQTGTANKTAFYTNEITMVPETQR